MMVIPVILLRVQHSLRKINVSTGIQMYVSELKAQNTFKSTLSLHEDRELTKKYND